MRTLLPCKMREYRGSNWYRRLIANEFWIKLDNGSSTEIIQDKMLACIPDDDPRIGQYHSAIRELFSLDEAEWDELCPGDLVRVIRRLRTGFFSTDELDSGCFQESPRESDADLSDEVRRHFAGKKEIILVPDMNRIDDSTRELVLFSQRVISQPKITLAVPNEHLAESWPSAITDFLELPRPEEITVDILAACRVSSAQTLVVADLWYFYALMAQRQPFVSCLDPDEWLVCALYGTNRDIDLELSCPSSQSRYFALLQELPLRKRNRIASLWEASVAPERLSGVHINPSKTKRFPEAVINRIADGSIASTEGFFSEVEAGLWEERRVPEAGALHAAAVFLDGACTRVNPVFASRMVASPEVPPEGISFDTSFNYYFTDSLLRWYAIRDNRPLEWKRFMLDYIGVFDKHLAHNGEAFESIPLYQKALIGANTEGKIFVHDGAFQKIKLTSGDRFFEFDETTINPEQPSEINLYLPSGGDRMVGEGRFCATFIHDWLWDVRRGPVCVPPFGAVVATTDLWQPGDHSRWSIDWINLPFPRTQLSWLAGGFNALITDGTNNYCDDESAERSLEREGWMNPLSLRTQETQLVPKARQPRALIGGTKKGDVFLLSISGRSTLSRGASFVECASLATWLTKTFSRLENDEISFLVNLDGGASAFLSASSPSESTLLTYPAPSDSNPAGVPRRVASFLRASMAFPDSK